MSNLTAHLKALEEKEEKTPKKSRRQENSQTQGQNQKIEANSMIQRINKSKSLFFEIISATLFIYFLICFLFFVFQDRV
jgi:ATP-dependent Zn protease